MHIIRLISHTYILLLALLLLIFILILDDFFTDNSFIIFFLPLGGICSLVYTPLIMSKPNHYASQLKNNISKYIRYAAAPFMFIFILLFISIGSSVALNMGLHLLSNKEHESFQLTIKEKRIPYKRYGYYGHVIFKEFSSGTYEVSEKTFLNIRAGQKVLAEGYSSTYGVELSNVEFR